MTTSISKAAAELWETHKETDTPVGQANFYYADNGEYFKRGVKAGAKYTLECAEVMAIIDHYRYLTDKGITGPRGEKNMIAFDALKKGE